MKAIKYFLVGALMTVVGAPAMAQTMSLDEALKVVRDSSKSVKEKEQALKAAKFNKKDVKQAVEVGYAFINANDTANARKYAELAIKADKKSAEGYILRGDLEAYCDNPGPAAQDFQNAIYFDKNNEKGYLRYAQIMAYSSPETSVETLNQLKAIKPDFPVEAECGHIYYNMATRKGKVSMFKDAADYYKKVELSKIPEARLTEFAMAAMFTQDYETSLNVVKFGLQKDPKRAGYNRIALYDCTDLKKYDEAVQYIKGLEQSDSVKFLLNDYKYAATAYTGNGQNAEAITYWQKIIDEFGDKEDNKLAALKGIADCYKNMNDKAKYVEAFKAYLAANPNATAQDYYAFANFFRSNAGKEQGEERTASVKSALGVYNEMITKFPAYADLCNYNAAQMSSILDPDSKQGTAKPYYETLAKSIEEHGVKDDNDKKRIIESYRYLGYFYYLKKDNATAKSYFQKVLNIDPENEQAKQAVAGIK